MASEAAKPYCVPYERLPEVRLRRISASECFACGVVFSKLESRPVTDLGDSPNATQPVPRPKRPNLVMVLAVVVVGVAAYLFFAGSDGGEEEEAPAPVAAQPVRPAPRQPVQNAVDLRQTLAEVSLEDVEAMRQEVLIAERDLERALERNVAARRGAGLPGSGLPEVDDADDLRALVVEEIWDETPLADGDEPMSENSANAAELDLLRRRRAKMGEKTLLLDTDTAQVLAGRNSETDEDETDG